MTFLAERSFFMLLESLFGSLAGHAHIEAFQYAIELRIGLSEFSILRIDSLLKFDNVDVVRH